MSLPSKGADLHCIGLFRGLSKADLDRILPALRSRYLRRGHALTLGDEFHRRVGFVWSGSSALQEASFVAMAAIAADQGSRIFELLAFNNTRGLVLAELLRLAREGEWQGRRCIVRPAPTHQALADQIGATRERITRILRELADETLIRTERSVIEILDIDRLVGAR